MIPARWPDFTLTVMNYLRDVLPGVTVTRTKRDSSDAQIVLATEPQQLETDVSRRVAVVLEAWKSLPNGAADVAGAVNLMNEVLYQLQLAPSVLTSVVRFDQPNGPSVQKDELKFEYAEGSIVLGFSL